MTIDLDELEARAKAATPGPWVIDPRNCDIVIRYADAGDVAEAQRISNAGNDAYYIAAVSPDVVLELIAELRAKNDLLEVYEWTEEHAKTALRNELKRVRAERDWLAEHIPNTVCPEGKSECDDRTPTAGGTVGYACLLCWLEAAREAVKKEEQK